MSPVAVAKLQAPVVTNIIIPIGAAGVNNKEVPTIPETAVVVLAELTPISWILVSLIKVSIHYSKWFWQTIILLIFSRSKSLRFSFISSIVRENVDLLYSFMSALTLIPNSYDE